MSHPQGIYAPQIRFQSTIMAWAQVYSSVLTSVIHDPSVDPYQFAAQAADQAVAALEQRFPQRMGLTPPRSNGGEQK